MITFEVCSTDCSTVPYGSFFWPNPMGLLYNPNLYSATAVSFTAVAKCNIPYSLWWVAVSGKPPCQVVGDGIVEHGRERLESGRHGVCVKDGKGGGLLVAAVPTASYPLSQPQSMPICIRSTLRQKNQRRSNSSGDLPGGKRINIPLPKGGIWNVKRPNWTQWMPHWQGCILGGSSVANCSDMIHVLSLSICYNLRCTHWQCWGHFGPQGHWKGSWNWLAFTLFVFYLCVCTRISIAATLLLLLLLHSYAAINWTLMKRWVGFFPFCIWYYAQGNTYHFVEKCLIPTLDSNIVHFLFDWWTRLSARLKWKSTNTHCSLLFPLYKTQLSPC